MTLVSRVDITASEPARANTKHLGEISGDRGLDEMGRPTKASGPHRPQNAVIGVFH